MASKPKKRMKYPPGSAKKALQAYVTETLELVKEHESWWLNTKLQNNSAMDNMVRGIGNPWSLEQLVRAFNMVRGFVLYKTDGEHIQELLGIQSVIVTIVDRVRDTQNFTLKANEIVALKSLVVLHDLYLENASLLDMREVIDRSRLDERNGDYTRLSLNKK